MDLIDREQAISKLEDLIIARRGWLSDGAAEIRGIDAAICELVALPSAEKTGEWIWDDEGYHCSECCYHAYENIGEILSENWHYCPNCGARMVNDNE